mmetsp:Transcript_51285/g.111312  ORF Transcript_51285/g.111312 Transcript_51285/m.111312 type:complete len:200 (-) Transcript_51285:399-998(-)
MERSLERIRKLVPRVETARASLASLRSDRQFTLPSSRISLSSRSSVGLGPERTDTVPSPPPTRSRVPALVGRQSRLATPPLQAGTKVCTTRFFSRTTAMSPEVVPAKKYSKSTAKATQVKSRVCFPEEPTCCGTSSPRDTSRCHIESSLPPHAANWYSWVSRRLMSLKKPPLAMLTVGFGFSCAQAMISPELVSYTKTR